VPLVNDQGHPAVPWTALRPSELDAEAWVELPRTRWGEHHRDLTARANFEHLEPLFPAVQRVLVVEPAEERFLMIRSVNLTEVHAVIDTLRSGGVLSEWVMSRIMQDLLRERIEAVELADVIERLWDAGICAVTEEEVVRLYMVLASDTDPVPIVDAVSVEIPAHDAVVDRLIKIGRESPEMVALPMGGASTWREYERRVGVQ
jgi:hypothetical protein